MPRGPAPPARLHLGCGVGLAATLLLAAAPASDASALVVSCADGSLVFARHWRDVHCAGATLVARCSIPPLGLRPPEPSLARRQAFRAQQESAREGALERQLADALSRRAAPPAVSSAASAAPAAEERRSLDRLLGSAPAGGVLQLELRGAQPARLRVAHSPALERRLRADLAQRGLPAPGPVVVFSLAEAAAGPGVPVPAFAQGGVTLRPDAADPAQLGWLGAGAPEPGRGTPRLGYVALPAGFDLTRPLVVFWGDAVAAARLRPAGPGAQRSASPTAS